MQLHNRISIFLKINSYLIIFFLINIYDIQKIFNVSYFNIFIRFSITLIEINNFI